MLQHAMQAPSGTCPHDRRQVVEWQGPPNQHKVGTGGAGGRKDEGLTRIGASIGPTTPGAGCPLSGSRSAPCSSPVARLVSTWVVYVQDRESP
jgi:hypothetical protein